MAQRYNKYLVPEKANKLNLYDIKIVKTYNGSVVNEDSLVAEVKGTKETFYLFFIPDYQKQQVSFGCDSNTDFAQQVTQLMMESGEANHLIKQVYDKVFNKSLIPTSIENGETTYIPVR